MMWAWLKACCVALCGSAEEDEEEVEEVEEERYPTSDEMLMSSGGREETQTPRLRPERRVRHPQPQPIIYFD